jgi:hypothetical protein
MVLRPRYVVRIQESMTKIICKAEVIRPRAKAVFVAIPASVITLA